MLDGQFRMHVVLKFLSLCIEVLAFELPQITILLDLIAPSLNIFNNSPMLLHTFSANFQAVLLNGLRKHLNCILF